jgi:uncharacterized phage protein (TIGR02220 family)
MAMSKNSFVIMDTWAVILEGMPEHTTSEVIKMICRYQMTGQAIRSSDAGANALFDAWKPTLDENNATYSAKVDRATKAREKKNTDINSDIKADINADIKDEIKDDINNEIKVEINDDINADSELKSRGVSDSVSVNKYISPNGDIVEQTIDEVIGYLNAATQSNFKKTTEAYRKTIRARLNEGYTLDDFKKVIDSRVKIWGEDERMREYLRPQTLFRPSNFESYLNEANRPRPSNKTKFNDIPKNDYDFDALEKQLIRN